MFSMLTEISVVPSDRQMGQTHPEQHGSPAWTYISTILFGIHNSFVEDRYCCWSFICWSLILSLIQVQEKQTQSSRCGQYATECDLKLHFSVFLQVYSADSSLFLYADSKVPTVTCSLSRKESLNWWSPQFSIPVWSQLTSSWWRLKTLYFLQSSEVEMQTVAIPHLLFSTVLLVTD